MLIQNMASIEECILLALGHLQKALRNFPSPTPSKCVDTASSCSLKGCSGYDPFLCCTHCRNGNACITNADCRSGWACDTTYIGSNPDPQKYNSSGFCYQVPPSPYPGNSTSTSTTGGMPKSSPVKKSRFVDSSVEGNDDDDSEPSGYGDDEIHNESEE